MSDDDIRFRSLNVGNRRTEPPEWEASRGTLCADGPTKEEAAERLRRAEQRELQAAYATLDRLRALEALYPPQDREPEFGTRPESGVDRSRCPRCGHEKWMHSDGGSGWRCQGHNDRCGCRHGWEHDPSARADEARRLRERADKLESKGVL